MEYISKTVTLKNGKPCLIRRGEEQDAELLIEHWKTTAAETRNLTREPSEDDLTVEEQRALIREKNEEENVLNLLAFVDGQHAGNCAFNPVEDSLRVRHRCAVGIALYQKFCGMGVGTALLSEILAAAKAAIDGPTATINVETLAPGTYVVTVATADGSRRSAKLIKR